ncbi:MAG: hypothetical protein COB61_005575 [Thiotrichales bacterium]|nr:hypothetical protein [Thiotrichales bacterium]
MPNKQVNRSKQRGAALVVSLVILLVMTIIGVTGMNQSALETLMASNLQVQTQSLSSAENQLIAAEISLRDIAITPAAFINYDENINPILELLNAADANFDQDGEYTNTYIEYIGPQTVSGESIVIGNNTPIAGNKIYLFRNTAIHSNRDNGARRIVQSVYAIEQDPASLVNGDENG